ncbi:MAG: FAD-dependent oxidoreductase [Candidatus Promineifilaceae bacterium]
MTTQTDILIIGAGIAGLMAAHKLQQNGRSVLVLDKSREVGGRMATRRIGPGLADHGAQFFTVRTRLFGQYVQQWQTDGIVHEWSRGWTDGSAGGLEPDGHPRYVGSTGMTAVPKFLAASLPVRLNEPVTAVTPTAAGWQTTTENGRIYTSSGLILTPPVPQSLALLQTGSTPLHPDDRAALESIAYAPTVAGLFWVDGRVALPSPGALQRPDHDFPFIADNQRKGISPRARIITIHAHPRLATVLWDAPPKKQLAVLHDGLRPFLGASTIIIEAQVHRWQYAIPTVLYPQRTLLAQNLPPLAFAGDAFNGPRVEGAAVSGVAAAKMVEG